MSYAQSDWQWVCNIARSCTEDELRDVRASLENSKRFTPTVLVLEHRSVDMALVAINAELARRAYDRRDLYDRATMWSSLELQYADAQLARYDRAQ
jgi:hypothetical protein